MCTHVRKHRLLQSVGSTALTSENILYCFSPQNRLHKYSHAEKHLLLVRDMRMVKRLNAIIERYAPRAYMYGNKLRLLVHALGVRWIDILGQCVSANERALLTNYRYDGKYRFLIQENWINCFIGHCATMANKWSNKCGCSLSSQVARIEIKKKSNSRSICSEYI